MVVIESSYEIVDEIGDVLGKLERIGRTCYHSEDKIKADGESAKRFIHNIIERGHESVIEHVSITVKFVCNRETSHQLVRHRLASYTQESQRYCNYADSEKYPEGIIFIKPCDMEYKTNDYRNWVDTCMDSEFGYFQAIKCGLKPEQARLALNNSVATCIYMTTNLREWRHVLKLRCSKEADPQIRALMIPLAKELKERIPIIFDDIEVD